MKASEYLERIDHDNQLVECPACGTDAGKFTDLSRVDRYGMPARFVICPVCAGVWITPRMNSGEYEKFYAGASFIIRNHSFREAPWSMFDGYVDGLMSSYDVPEAAQKTAAVDSA